MKCQNKFWLENPADLVCSFSLLPMKGMDLAEQMNAASRLVIVITLALLLIDSRKAIYFLISAIILIIILYYIQKKGMEKTESFLNSHMPGSIVERFEPEESQEYGYLDPYTSDAENISCCEPRQVLGFGSAPQIPGQAVVEYRTGKELSCQFCNDATETGSGPDFYSRNYALTGQANPRTLIKPIITPRSHDLDHWRANNLVTHSHINAESAVDLYQSGYEVSNCCDYTCDKNLGYTSSDIPGRAPVLSVGQEEPSPVTYGRLIDDTMGIGEDEIIEEFTHLPLPPGPPLNSGLPPYPPTNLSSSYSYPYYSANVPQTGAAVLGASQGPKKLGPLKSGMINVACGYNPSNVEVNLPTNAVEGMCPRDPAYADYNQNLYTQTIQPGVYAKSQINQPINANIGISFQQQFEPITCQSNNSGVFFTGHDPRIIEPVEYQDNSCPQMDSKGQRVNRSNVYDPRFNGYGTSYRSYNDPLLGNVKYNYDDINLIKQPNYIVRSKIDSFQFADKYGPAKPQMSLGGVKALAQDKFLRDSLSHRTGLQERWMNKMNTILAQRRKAPILTSTGSGQHNRCK